MMERTVSATDARVHFGELMRQAESDGRPIVVEHSGKPRLVLMSIAAYERLKAASERDRDWLAAVDRVREGVGEYLAGRALQPPEEVLQQVREARDEQHSDLP